MREKDGDVFATNRAPSAATALRHAPTRRERLLTAIPLAATVVAPVVALVALEGDIGSASDVGWAVLISAVFFACLESSFGAVRNELLPLGTAVAVARGAAIGFVAVSAIGVWADGFPVSVAGLLASSFVILGLAMLSASRMQQHRSGGRVLIVGAGGGSRDLVEEMRLAPKAFEPIGIVDDVDGDAYAGVPVLGQFDDLPRVIEAERPDIVVLSMERNRPAIFRHLLDHASLGFRVVELAQFYEHAFGRVPVRDLTRAWFMSVLHLYQRPYSRAANRAFDVAVASILLVASLPLLLVIPLLILTTRGPVILRQTRLGEHGKPFTMYKFRTMRSGAEAPGEPVWASPDDPRVTVVGRLMRRFRIDEIPQLWNVLKGEMSIVGPRPERPEFLAMLQESVPFWDRRHLIKPGITGWAQIRRGYTADTSGSAEKLSFDLWYLRHRSLGVDFAICVQTIAVLLRGGPPAHPARARLESPRTASSALSRRLLAAARTARLRNGSHPNGAHAVGAQSDPRGAAPSTRNGNRPPLYSGAIPEHPIAVLGAGPAGLTAAHALAHRQLPAVMFEADAQVGGLAKTVEVDGYRFDLGGHRFFTKLAPVERLWEKMLGSDFLVRPRLSRIYYKGEYFAYPIRAADVPRRLGMVEFARCLMSYAAATTTRRRSADTFEEWVTNRFGRRLYDTFFRSYTEKVWGIPGSEIRSEWAAQRIKNLSLWRAAVNMLGLSRTPITSLIEEFKYPRLGPGQMWEAFQAEVEDSGIPVLLDHKVVRLRHDGSRVGSVVVESNGSSAEWNVEGVLSSIALKDLVLGLDPAPPEEVLAAARRLRYRDFCLVALMTSEEQPFADNWIYLHDPETRAGRVQNFGAWSDALVRPGTTCLGVEYFCFAGDDIWHMPEDEAVALATDELSRIGLIDPAKVFAGAKVRVPKAYPMYDGAYRESVDVIRRYLGSFENLQTFGRNGLHRYNNQDHSMWTALVATLNLVDGVPFDVWSINTDAAYHEEGEMINAFLGDHLEDEAAPAAVRPTRESILRHARPLESVE